jgi:hypothetical protein
MEIENRLEKHVVLRTLLALTFELSFSSPGRWATRAV